MDINMYEYEFIWPSSIKWGWLEGTKKVSTCDIFCHIYHIEWWCWHFICYIFAHTIVLY